MKFACGTDRGDGSAAAPLKFIEHACVEAVNEKMEMFDRELEVLRKSYVDALQRIEVKAQAGLCYFTLESAREFLKDIREEVADALGKERPVR